MFGGKPPDTGKGLIIAKGNIENLTVGWPLERRIIRELQGQRIGFQAGLVLDTKAKESGSDLLTKIPAVGFNAKVWHHQSNTLIDFVIVVGRLRSGSSIVSTL